MRHPEPKNLAASVRQKLFDLARSRKEDFGLMLVKYGLERILYRLSRSKYRDAFVLKGALLLELWTQRTYRATRDADFLAVQASTKHRRFAPNPVSDYEWFESEATAAQATHGGCITPPCS